MGAQGSSPVRTQSREFPDDLVKLIDKADSQPICVQRKGLLHFLGLQKGVDMTVLLLMVLKGDHSSRPSLAVEGERTNDFDATSGVDLLAGSSEVLKRTEASLAVVLKQLTAATRSS